MALDIISEDGVEPITLDEAKRQCYISVNNTSTEVENVIKAVRSGARKWAENYLWRQLIDATLEYKIDEFPDEAIIELPRPPLISVESITYENDGTQTLDSSKYRVDTSSEPGRVEKDSGSWPATDQQVNAVTIKYKAGYGDDTTPDPDESTVPEDIKIGLRMLIKFLYDNRDAYVIPDRVSSSVVEMPIGTKAMLDPYSARRA